MKKLLQLVLALFLVIGIVSAFDGGSASDLSEKDVKTMKVTSRIPATYDLAVEKLRLVPMPTKFLLYTRDGNNIMWGVFADGYFRAKDNSGKYVWGIYGNTVFAGFYDNNFFWGKYRNGNWKAYGLFNRKESNGKYVMFPDITPTAATLESVQ